MRFLCSRRTNCPLHRRLAVPMTPTPARISSTTEFASAVPLRINVSSLVISSLALAPVSSRMLLMTGADGAVLSMT